MSMILDPSGRPAEVAMTPREHPLAPRHMMEPERMEVCRSFSYKLSIKNMDGSPTYESADFFCSFKSACTEETRAEVSADLDQFCVDDVVNSIREFKERRARKGAQKERAA